ncbi:MAG: 1-acyl-sn-glycerol-3-phosphate acyltransferase [Gemmatimonadaceae bacterium]|nr:1-acyl-sn-glycerol-3-phosphate acyltransferase [Gemmatimonadaceae bacterium]
MLYDFLRWIAGIALHWFYSDIRVVGQGRVPAGGPIIVAANHPNALVDALVAGWILPRRLSITAKATLVENPVLAVLFRMLGIVPLRRVSDERRKDLEGTLDPSRNEGAFDRVMHVLKESGVVLIFPEGKSHNQPTIAPLRTGLARIALQARDNNGIHGIRILPLGLKFQAKGEPNSVVIAEFGEPIDVDALGGVKVEELTALVEKRLRGVADLTAEDVFVARTGESRVPGLKKSLLRVVALWGEWVHRFPIQAARNMAIRKGGDEDQPAMLTIVYGLGIIALYYFIVGIVAGLVGGFLLALVLILALGTGAYWAAFKDRPRGY